MESSIRHIKTGLFESVGSWKHPHRTIDSSELICVLRGDVYIEAGGTKYLLQRGCMLHIAANTAHGGFRMSEDVSFFWMHYHTDVPVFTWCYGGMILNDAAPAVNTEPHESAGFLRTEQLLRHLMHVENSDGYPAGTTDLIARLVLIEAKRQYDAVGSESVLTSRIDEWIRLHARQRIRVTDVAEAFGYNVDYITRTYRSVCGSTIKEAIDAARMDVIRSLLLSGQYALGELWDQVGFEDYKSFLKYFTYHAGMTPTAYKKLYSGVHINHK